MITEIALVSLALQLATGPTAQSVSTYNKLEPGDQAKVQVLVEQQDLLPARLQAIVDKNNLAGIAEPPAPTGETSSPGTGAAMLPPQPTSESSGGI